MGVRESTWAEVRKYVGYARVLYEGGEAGLRRSNSAVMWGCRVLGCRV